MLNKQLLPLHQEDCDNPPKQVGIPLILSLIFNTASEATECSVYVDMLVCCQWSFRWL